MRPCVLAGTDDSTGQKERQSESSRKGPSFMSHLTDKARASRIAQADITIPVKLGEIVAANPERRKLLKNGLLGFSLFPFARMSASHGAEEASAAPKSTSTSPAHLSNTPPSGSARRITAGGAIRKGTRNRIAAHAKRPATIGTGRSYLGKLRPVTRPA